MTESGGPRTFRLLTFNVWGLKYLSKKRTERLSALNALLLTSPDHVYDVICLQELWVEADFLFLKSSLCQKYPYSAYCPSSVVGSGLAVFSKWELVGRDFLAFGVCGEPGEIGGDWYAGKGVGSVILNVGGLGEVEVFNSHFFAKGGEEGPETRRSVRISNAWEMAKLVRKAASNGRHIIAAGDFNSSPHSLPMKIMFLHANLIDTWAATHPAPPINPIGSIPSGRRRVVEPSALDALGLTVDTPLNSWSAGKTLDSFARRWLGKRLDYILYQAPAPAASLYTLSLQDTTIVLTERVPGHDFSYSDHFGLEATFNINNAVSSTSPGHSREVISPSNQLSREDILTAIGALSHALHSSYSRTRRHTLYLAICAFFLVLSIVGPAWLNTDSTRWKWNAFLAAVVAAATTFGCTMAVCVGLIYGIRERGRLTNLIEEMECESRRHQAQS